MGKRFLFELRVAGPARRDIAAIIRWSYEHFGEAAALRYQALIAQAFLDLQADPTRPGSKERLELPVQGTRTYHLAFSSDRVVGERVKEPRHFVLYRQRQDGSIDVVRILHDSRDLQRHLRD